MKYSEKLAFLAVTFIRILSTITIPFVKLLTCSTNIISSIFGVTGEEEEQVSEEEIKMMVDVGEEKGTIETGEKEMINNIFEFNDRLVSEIMIPRTQVYALDMELTISEAIDLLNEDTRYSRVPVYEENIDNIKGIVYLKDMLLTQKNKNTKLKNIAREATFILESIYIDDAFKELKKSKKQIAIAIDEYGGTAGIITMEDILEEIVGEIYDEYDVEESKYKKIDNNTFLGIYNPSLSYIENDEIYDEQYEETRKVIEKYKDKLISEIKTKEKNNKKAQIYNIHYIYTDENNNLTASGEKIEVDSKEFDEKIDEVYARASREKSGEAIVYFGGLYDEYDVYNIEISEKNEALEIKQTDMRSFYDI